MRNIPEKISRTKRRKYFFCHSGNGEHRPAIKIAGGANSAKCCHCFVIASQPFVFSRIVPHHHYQPRCHATITGASHINSPIIGRAAICGGHPFEHRDVLAPGLACPSLDHHGLSLRGKNRSRSSCRDSAHRHHRWDKAVAKRRERGRFLGGASISVPLSLLLPPGAACASLTSLAGCWRETAALVFAWKESPR